MQPWESEFSLDPTTTRELLREAFPELRVESVEYLHQGWDNFAFLVNDVWVFRFAKREERRCWVDSELAVLKLLEGGVSDVAIPIPTYIGEPSRRFPCRFMGYRLLPGTSADHFPVDDVNREISAKRLGGLLSAIHRIDAETARRRSIPTEQFPCAEGLKESTSFHDTLRPHLSAELFDLCQPYLAGTCALPEEDPGRYCLVHGDLLDEHILIDEAGCVSGVIDWGDACISDPAVDLAGVCTWMGTAFLQQVLKHYDHPAGPEFVERALFLARCLALTNAGWSLQGRGTSTVNRLTLLHQVFGNPACD